MDNFYRCIEQTFDAFCKAVIRNESRQIHRELARREAWEIPLEGLNIAGGSYPRKEEYRPGRTLHVHGRPVQIHDPMLAQAILWLPPQKRDIILLYYFFEYSEPQIGKILGLSASAVNRRHRQALERLREILEGMGYER